MFLKNVTVFRMSKPFAMDADELNKKLSEDAFKPCASQEFKRSGWVAPHMMPEDQFVRAADGCLQIALKTEEKVMPSAVVDGEVAERVAAIEEDQERRVKKNERQEIKEQVIQELLPRAFSKYSLSIAYVDTTAGLLVIGEGSPKKAEDLASFLRKTIGSLPVRPIAVEEDPSFVMTQLIDLNRDFTNNMQAGFNTVLKDPLDSKKTVTCKGVEPHSDEVRKHIDESMQVTTMTLGWDDKVFFEIDEKLIIKKLSFGEQITSELDEVDADDEMALYDAMYVLFAQTLRDLVNNLTELFGGEDKTAVVEEDDEE